jgi:hypothetical protein
MDEPTNPATLSSRMANSHSRTRADEIRGAVQFLAQVADVDVDRTVVGAGRPVVEPLCQLVPRHDVACGPHQHLENVELDGRHLHQVPILGHHARGRIQPDAANLNGRKRIARLAPRAPQNRLHSGQQFHRLERLGEVIVGACIETADAAFALRARGQQEHRRIALRPQPLQYFEPIQSRHHHVQQDQVEAAAQRHFQALHAILRGRQIDLLPAEEIAHQRRQFGVVIDQQQM